MLTLLPVSLAYWWMACRIASVAEPWDADAYWLGWYPGSLLLSVLGGILLARRAWLAGVIVTAAQLPVMWWNGAGGALWLAGGMILCVLAIPAAALAHGAAWIVGRRH